MPKCNRCPISIECKKSGKIKFKRTKADGKEEFQEACPLLYVISVLLQSISEGLSVDESKMEAKNGK